MCNCLGVTLFPPANMLAKVSRSLAAYPRKWLSVAFMYEVVRLGCSYIACQSPGWGGWDGSSTRDWGCPQIVDT